MPDFLRETKEALSTLPVRAAFSRRAELAAIIAGAGYIDVSEARQMSLLVQSESLPLIRRTEFLLRALTGREPEVNLYAGAGQKTLYSVMLREPKALVKLLKELGFMSSRGVLRETEVHSPESLLKNEEARKAFLRGAFLAGGYLADPNQAYHFEIVVRSEERAEELAGLLRELGVKARTTLRRGADLVYVKDSAGISDVLSLMGAMKSRLEWENVRILRGMKGQINRQVNCETANLEKAGRAGHEQAEAIKRIMDRGDFGELPVGLKQIALLRLADPDASLGELGERLDPPIGRSGVNHRLRKIMEIAGE